MGVRKPRPPRDLGELELAVMQAVWAAGEATVQGVSDALAPQRTPAYTTGMTVMSRLADKRLLRRRKVGRAFVYAPAASQETVARSTFETGFSVDGAFGRPAIVAASATVSSGSALP